MQIYDPDNDPGTEREAFKLLKNPLPEPPRRNHVRMEFDLAMDGEDDSHRSVTADSSR